MNDLFKLIRTAIWLAVFGALYQELKRPADERTWTGKVLGVVPYDFRVPTWDRLRASYWNPESEEIFTERVFGVGWGVNIPVALRKLNASATQYLSASRNAMGRGAKSDEVDG